MFHNLFDTVNFASVLGQFCAVTLIILPTFIASVRKTENLTMVALLNGLSYALIDISAFISKESSNDTISTVVFVCAWILWAVTLILAIALKKKNSK